jgi:hypothetical protein
MPTPTYKISSKVLVYPGMGGWRFLVVPKKISKDIKEKYSDLAAGWGSLRVGVSIGKTEWKTSIFPDKKSGTYLLPLKAPVRKAESIADGDKVNLTIKLQL